MNISVGIVHVGASERFCYFLFGKSFRGFWATLFEILALELQEFCEIFAESVLFLTSYLVSNSINSRKKQEK